MENPKQFIKACDTQEDLQLCTIKDDWLYATHQDDSTFMVRLIEKKGNTYIIRNINGRVGISQTFELYTPVWHFCKLADKSPITVEDIKSQLTF